MKVFTYDYKDACVVERECEVFGYPNRDSSGGVQYNNTHFRTELEAWQALIPELEAGLSLGSSARIEARRRLDEITTRLADDAERLVKAKAGFEAFRRETAR